jgi:AcrR family transcriptional regulator
MHAKPTRQRRSHDKRERILRAMDALLVRKPFAEISVLEVAAKAKVAPATIYQRFSNADATASVVLELYFQKVEEWARRPRERVGSPVSLFEGLLAIARDAHDQITALAYVMRPAYLYSRHRPDRAGAEWNRLRELALAGFKGFLRQHSRELRVPDVDAAAALLAYLFNFMLLGPLLHADEMRESALGTREQFAESVATLAYRYLTCGGAGGGKLHGVAAS